MLWVFEGKIKAPVQVNQFTWRGFFKLNKGKP
jgi:hypothetical protein